MSSASERLAVMAEQISTLYKNAEHFITDDEFDPVKKLVYGMVASILIAVIGGIMTLIIKQ